MKNILILTGKVNRNRKNLIDFFGENIIKDLYDVVLKKLDETMIEIKEGNPSVLINGVDVNNFDLIYFRGVGSENYLLATSLALCFRKMNIKFFDSLYGRAGASRNKLVSLIELSLDGVKVPDTIFVSGKYKPQYFDLLSSKFGLPFVAKDLSVQKGRGVILIKSLEDLIGLKKIKKDGEISKYLFQKFIERDKEYRVLVLKDEVGVWEEKIPTREGEFRANVSLGAREEFLGLENITNEISQASIKASRILGIEVAGVDLLLEKGTNSIYVLEVNRGPGFTYKDNSPEFAALAKFLQKEASK